MCVQSMCGIDGEELELGPLMRPLKRPKVGPKLVSSAVWLNRYFVHDCFPDFEVCAFKAV